MKKNPKVIKPTKAGARVASRIAKYKENPAKKARKASAVRPAKNVSRKRTVKKSKRPIPQIKAPTRSPRGPTRRRPIPQIKKPTRAARKGPTLAQAKAKQARQQAALRRSAVADANRALKARYGTTNLAEIEQIKKREEAAAAASTSSPRAAKAAKAKGAAMAARKKRTTKTKGKRKSRKGKRKSKRSPATTVRQGKTRAIRYKRPVQVTEVRVIERAPKRRAKKRKLKSNPTDVVLYGNPSYGGGFDRPAYSGLFENPSGPFSTASLGSYAVAIGGLGFGLGIARLTDRYIATRTPGPSGDKGEGGRRPYYGRAAALAILGRPDGWRFGAQAVGAIAGIGGAYLSRDMTLLPWAMGGLALGFGTNLILMGLESYLMPAIFKVEKENANKESVGNRLYPFEQAYVQDDIDKVLDNWLSNPILAGNQQEGNPLILSPLNIGGGESLIGLGAAQRQGAAKHPFADAVGKNAAGRVGTSAGDGGCPGGCGGGCSDTPGGCVDCNEKNGVPRLCEYTVQQGDDLFQLIGNTGYSVSDVNSMNGGRDPSAYWYPGSLVTLPRSICLKLINKPAPTQLRTNMTATPEMLDILDRPNLNTVPGLPGTTAFDLRGTVGAAQEDDADEEARLRI